MAPVFLPGDKHDFQTFTNSGSARTQDTMHDGLADQLLACDDIVDLTTRLMCFNAIVDALKPAATPPVAEIKAKPVQDSDLRTPELEPDPKQSVVSPSEPENFGRESMKTDPGRGETEPVTDSIQMLMTIAN